MKITPFFLTLVLLLTGSFSALQAQSKVKLDTFLMQSGKVHIVEKIDEDDKTYKYLLPRNGYSRYLKKEDVIAMNNNIYCSDIQVVLKDESIFIGELMAYTPEEIIIDTDYKANFSIDLESIVSISKAEKATSRLRKNKVGLSENYYKQPINTRYFFGTSALPMKKGTGYYQNTWILFNQFAVGVTDRVSVGGGLVPTFLFFNDFNVPVWGTIKFSIPTHSDNLHFSAGTLVGTILRADSPDMTGLLFSQVTLGDFEKNITLGFGYGFHGGALAERPTISVNGLLKIGKNVALITENYPIVGEELFVYSGGARLYFSKATLDIALVGFQDTSADKFQLFDSFRIPWLAFSIPFGDY